MIPLQWIEQMGAGWNLGNTFECHAMNLDNIKFIFRAATGYVGTSIHVKILFE